VVVEQGALIPRSEQSRRHSARVCKIGPDGMIYITLGQPYAFPPPRKLAPCDAWGIGGIIRMNTDGIGHEVHTYGVRNPVGHDSPRNRRALVHQQPGRRSGRWPPTWV